MSVMRPSAMYRASGAKVSAVQRGDGNTCPSGSGEASAAGTANTAVSAASTAGAVDAADVCSFLFRKNRAVMVGSMHAPLS